MDLSFEEFQFLYTGFNGHSEKFPIRSFKDVEDAPTSVDWRSALPPIKNQGQCGSCWAFSATCALEALNFIKTGEMKVLSEQSIVDCSHDNNFGCRGGMPDRAFTYTSENGIPLSKDYPYTGRDG